MTRNLLMAVMLLGVSTASWAQASFSSPETGTKVLGSYFASEIDSVSLKNGNLHLAIPLFTLPGRELPLSLGVTYDSRFVEKRTLPEPNPPTPFWEFYGWRKTSPVGGQLVASKTLVNPYELCGLWCTWNVTFTWVQANGSKQTWTTQVPVWGDNPPEYAVYDNLTLTTTDSEFLRLSTGTHFNPYVTPEQPAVVHFKNGTKITFQGNNRELQTTNGNRLTVTGDATSSTTNNGDKLYDLLPSSDTTGRAIGYSGGSTETITLTDFSGQPKIYRIHWGTIPALYPNQYVNSTFRVVTSIDLPNNQSYQFQYTPMVC